MYVCYSKPQQSDMTRERNISNSLFEGFCLYLSGTVFLFQQQKKYAAMTTPLQAI
jgi:hypothetical protein